MGRWKVIELVLTNICISNNVESIYIRRWGSKDSFKASKLVSLIRDYEPKLYHMLKDSLGCSNDSCITRNIVLWMRYSLKKPSKQYYTLGDICNELLQTEYE